MYIVQLPKVIRVYGLKPKPILVIDPTWTKTCTLFLKTFFFVKVIYGLIETLPYQTGMIRKYNVKFVLTLTYVLSTTGHCLRHHYQTWKAINKRRKHLGWDLIVICCLKCMTQRGYHPPSSRRFVTDKVF